MGENLPASVDASHDGFFIESDDRSVGMKRMIKMGILLVAAGILLLSGMLTVSAEEPPISEELISASGADELTEDLDADVQTVLDK